MRWAGARLVGLVTWHHGVALSWLVLPVCAMVVVGGGTKVVGGWWCGDAKLVEDVEMITVCLFLMCMSVPGKGCSRGSV